MLQYCQSLQNISYHILPCGKCGIFCHPRAEMAAFPRWQVSTMINRERHLCEKSSSEYWNLNENSLKTHGCPNLHGVMSDLDCDHKCCDHSTITACRIDCKKLNELSALVELLHWLLGTFPFSGVIKKEEEFVTAWMILTEMNENFVECLPRQDFASHVWSLSTIFESHEIKRQAGALYSFPTLSWRLISKAKGLQCHYTEMYFFLVWETKF